jgi:hypothetical protein
MVEILLKQEWVVHFQTENGREEGVVQFQKEDEIQVKIVVHFQKEIEKWMQGAVHFQQEI